MTVVLVNLLLIIISKNKKENMVVVTSYMHTVENPLIGPLRIYHNNLCPSKILHFSACLKSQEKL